MTAPTPRRRDVRLVTLGDSFSCGEGVGVRVELAQTWGGLLAAALPGCTWTALAAPGARLHDVRHSQLPAALAARPDVATVLVGLNDVIRAGFDADVVARDLRSVVTTLRERGCTVLLGRLHDPAALLGLVGPLRRGVASRVAAVNGAVDRISSASGSPVLDLGAVAALTERPSWAVDRLHPSSTGHQAIAAAAAQALSKAGVPVHVAAVTSQPQQPGAAAQLRWLVAHGLPWGASHVRSVGLPLLVSAMRA